MVRRPPHLLSSVAYPHFNKGSNANTLRLVPAASAAANPPGTPLRSDSVAEANCVNGVGQTDLFGEFAYCNAPNFFTAASKLINAGKIMASFLPF